MLSLADSGTSWTRADIWIGLFLERYRPARVMVALRALLPQLIADTLPRGALERAFG